MDRMRKFSTILIIVSLASLVTSVYGLLTTMKILNTDGTVTNFLITSDELTLNETTIIKWGDILPGGDTVDRTVYLKNLGGENLTITMNATNWKPVNASKYMTFSWDGDNVIPTGGLAVPLTLYLTVHLNATECEPDIGPFSFDIEVTATPG